MAQLYHTLLDLMGVTVALSLIGWSFYRLAILFGIISVKKMGGKGSSRHYTNLDRQGGQKTSTNTPHKTTPNRSRQALYSARKDRG